MIQRILLSSFTKRTVKQMPRLTSPCFKLAYQFSSNSEKIKAILRHIKIEMDNKESNLLDSGVVASQHLDPETKKLKIALNLTKDYMKIKNILKESLKVHGFEDVDITLAPKQEK